MENKVSAVNSKKPIRLVFVALLLNIFQITIASELENTRSFNLGFTYQPYDWSEDAFEETYSFIRKNSDMISLYFDDGVPWDEALKASQYHDNVMKLINTRIKHIGDNQKVMVGVNFLGKNRRTLADYWGKEDSLPRKGKWAERGINHTKVIEAYVSYCRFMIKRFKPDYFIYGMEVDSVELDITSEEFLKLENMLSEIYKQLRHEFKELPLILTFTLAPDENMEKRKLIVKRLLPYTDIYAVSTYPYLFDGIGGNSELIPHNFFSRVRGYIGDKPFAIAETGFNAKTWRVLSQLIWVPGDEKSQANYVNFLLKESNELNAEFVNWWVPRDLDALWGKMDKAGADPILSQWNSNGLVDAQGFPREGLYEWNTWLKKIIKQRKDITGP
jgi:hypothetical protein